MAALQVLAQCSRSSQTGPAQSSMRARSSTRWCWSRHWPPLQPGAGLEQEPEGLAQKPGERSSLPSYLLPCQWQAHRIALKSMLMHGPCRPSGPWHESLDPRARVLSPSPACTAYHNYIIVGEVIAFSSLLAAMLSSGECFVWCKRRSLFLHSCQGVHHFQSGAARTSASCTDSAY